MNLLDELKAMKSVYATFEGICFLRENVRIDIKKAFLDRDTLRIAILKNLETGVLFHSFDTFIPKYKDVDFSALVDDINIFNNAANTSSGLLTTFYLKSINK